jgi:rhamnopyranosyl-N-acetylglucosaminyl-diphospho-decaprenol beta-1,3/1,4-galactofuranosyltransferase
MVEAPTFGESTQRVCAVVVTHNRRELLRRCLAALAAQDRPVDETLVVDNASHDGTAEMVRDEFGHVQLLRLEENVGGAGGFHRGIAWAYDRGHEWLWLMDDDTITVTDSLATLLSGAARAPAGPPLLVASQVLWKDDRLHPMNAPVPRWRSRGALAEGIAHGLLALRYAGFVSVAIRREAIERFGLPLAHFFIWGDDVEFTARVLRHEPGYLVPESRVYHWTETPHPAATPTSDRFYYHARNSLLLLRGDCFAPIERLDYGRYYARTVLDYIRVNRWNRRRLAILARGIRDGLIGPTR